MSVELVWSRRAKLRLAEIGDYIAERDPVAAYRLIDSLFESVGRLADHPHLGVAFPGSPAANVRVMYVDNYRVFYFFDAGAPRVTILTVRHGRQAPISLDQALSEDEP